MNHTEKIKKAKIQLILQHPFFAMLCMRLPVYADASVKTASTNGKVIRYKPEFINTLRLEEVMGVIAHEIMHIILMHHTRRNHRDVKLWNVACDHAINPMLLNSGFILPEGHLFDPTYANKSAEQIYHLLPQPAGDGDTSGNDDDEGESTGEVQDAPADASRQEMEAEIKQAMVQAAMIAGRQDRLPAFAQRLIEETLRPKVFWKEVLSRFMAEITRNDYTWKKPSPRYLQLGLYLPSLETTETGKAVLIVDTSSSIDQDILNQCGAEVQDIASTINLRMSVIYVDTIVQAVQEIDPDIRMQLQPRGGGGTDFRPGFEYIEQHELEPRVVIYLTDGACHLLPEEPGYPVLWALFGNFPFNPPFGETVQIM